MHRFGFLVENVRRGLNSKDFHKDPLLRNEANMEQCLSGAVLCLAKPGEISRHIDYRILRKKPVASTNSSSSRIALRLVNSNIVSAFGAQTSDRESIVRALIVLLAETVRYRVYKFDVKAFYESFDSVEAQKIINSNTMLTDPVRRVIGEVFAHHATVGHSGLPRGLVISASLSDALMSDFDRQAASHVDVFFYRRYVDDITIVTSGREDVNKFSLSLQSYLPRNLVFKRVKNKVRVLSSFKPKDSDKPGKSVQYVDFEYLGYKFNVASQHHQPSLSPVRHVWLDIADSKVKKIKTRIIRSYLDFNKTKDFTLLEKRIKHLTSNISLKNHATGLKRLSGIFYSYPLIDVDRSRALVELDKFLKSSILVPNGSVFMRLTANLSASQRSSLLRHTFHAGAKNKRFYQFGVRDLGRIQRCWKYA